jgi:hypothetical protein
MGLLDQLNHLMNFLAPAIAVGTLLALVTPLFYGKRPLATGMLMQAAINSIAGCAVLAIGLWYFERDGKMATYGAMLLACVISQGIFSRRAP